jgi:hypothetical protein
MAAETSQVQHSTDGASLDGARAVLQRQLFETAERELGRAIFEQIRPAMGMHVHPSSAEVQAFDVAVREICLEALRLDLRAEELLVGIKQAWSQLAPMRARHLGDRDGDVLRAVVSGSIEVFFEQREARALDG